MSSIVGSYFGSPMDPPKDGKDKKETHAKSESPPAIVLSNRKAARSAMGIKGNKNGLIKTKLIITASAATSAANTAQAGYVAIQPDVSPEFTFFAQLYDDVKVLGGEIRFNIITSAQYGSGLMAVILYDPGDNASLGSISQALSAKTNFHWWLGPTTTLGCTQTYPTKSAYGHVQGMNVLPFRVPNGTERNTSNASLMTGQWSSTATTGMQWGFMKYYITAAGIGGTTTIFQSYIVLECAFRNRQ